MAALLCPCLYHSSCVSPPNLYCVCACGRGFFSTGSARWIHSAIKSPIKPLVSLLLIARSFHQSTWLFESWLPCIFWPCSLCLAVETNFVVFLHLTLDWCARCTDSSFAFSLPAGGPACYRRSPPRTHRWLRLPRQDPGTLHIPSLALVFAPPFEQSKTIVTLLTRVELCIWVLIQRKP